MPSRRPTSPRRVGATISALVTAAALVAGSLTACGIGAENGAGSTAQAQETSFGTALGTFNSLVGDGLPDARDRQGVSHAATVGDVTPVSGDGVTSPADADLPVELTDADGHDVTVGDISRIIPLDIYGTLSRTLAGLGLRNNIVGRTVSSTEPALRDLPVVTRGGHSVNAEAVLNLNPSLILVDDNIGPAEALDQIRDAGVPVVRVSPGHTLDSVGNDIATVAGTVGLPRNGELLGERADSEISQATSAIREATDRAVPGRPLRMAFLYARGDGGVFYILGPDDGTDDLIESLGGVDAAKEEGIGQASPANAESLADLDPDVLVMMSDGLDSAGGLDGLLSRPGIAQTTAGENERVLAIPDSQSLSFGPQSGEMLLTAAVALYGG